MKIDTAHIAFLARLSLSQEENEKFGLQLGGILDYVEKLDELSTVGIEPTSHVLAIDNIMREDIPRPSLSRDNALLNAPDRSGDFYRVPKIIE